jgi:hypothetical protein
MFIRKYILAPTLGLIQGNFKLCEFNKPFFPMQAINDSMWYGHLQRVHVNVELRELVSELSRQVQRGAILQIVF